MNRIQYSQTLAVLAALAGILHAPPTRAADAAAAVTPPAPAQIQAPCTEDAKFTSASFLRKCSDVLNAAAPASPGVLPQLDQRIKTMIDSPPKSLYQGANMDLDSADPSNPTFTNFGTPVCVPVANAFNNGQPELDVNHNGQSCGAPARFDVHVSQSGVNAQMYLSGPNGVMEGAYLRGSWVQALTCYWQQVRHEIDTQHKLNISPSCSAFGASYANLSAGMVKVSSDLVTSLGGQQNIADIWNCKVTDDNMPANDVGSRRQSAQQLCSARASTEQLFAYSALCEVTARAGKGYRSLASDPAAFMEQIKAQAGKTVTSSCTAQCGGCRSASSCSSCATSCVNAVYPTALRKFYADKIQVWPNNGSCTL